MALQVQIQSKRGRGSRSRFFSPSDQDFTERLICEVQKHRCLYNPHEPGYKDRSKVDAKWQTVALSLGCTADAAKKRWRNVRGSYSRTCLRQALSDESSGASTKKRPPLFYLSQQLSFLEPYMHHRTMVGNSGLSEQEECEDSMESTSTSSPAPTAPHNQQTKSEPQNPTSPTSSRKRRATWDDKCPEIAYADLQTRTDTQKSPSPSPSDRDFTDRLVIEVQKQPCLYNPSEPGYQDRLRVDAESAWQDVALSMGCSAAVAKRRWKNLRGSYSKSRVNQALSGGPPSFYMSEQMSFLEPYMQHQPGRGKWGSMDLEIFQENSMDSPSPPPDPHQETKSEPQSPTNMCQMVSPSQSLSPTFTERLICEVQRHPRLYNPHAPGYKHASRVVADWQAVALSLETTAAVVKKRWKNLRGMYNRSRVKGSPSFYLSQQMSFLEPFMQHQPGKGNWSSIDLDIMDIPSMSQAQNESHESANAGLLTRMPVQRQSVKPTDRDFTERLICEVQRHPRLYNPQAPGYRDPSRVVADWQAVSSSMGTTADVVKKRWTNLRGSYSRSQVSKTVSGELPAFSLSKQMSFLEPYMQHKLRRRLWSSSEPDVCKDSMHSPGPSPSVPTSPFHLQIKSELQIPTSTSRGERGTTRDDECLEIAHDDLQTRMAAQSPSPNDRDFTERLICEVQKYPRLYNPWASGYRDQSKVVADWQAVALSMDCTADVVKKRWRNLRGSYSRSRVTQTLPDGSSSFYLSQQLSFLEPYMHSQAPPVPTPTHPQQTKSEPQSPTSTTRGERATGEDEQQETENDDLQTRMDTQNPDPTDRDFTERLICEVQGHPCLYNPWAPGHKDRSWVDAQWQAVALALCCTADVVKKRWRNLRGSYSRSHLSQAHSDGPSTKKRLPPFYLSEQLSFLEPYLQHKTMTENSDSFEDSMDSPSSSPPHLQTKSEPQSPTSTSSRDRMVTGDDEWQEIAHYDLQTGFDEASNHDLNSMKGLLPHLAHLSDKRKRQYFRQIYNLLFNMLDDQEESEDGT